jgi:hypothetical protein
MEAESCNDCLKRWVKERFTGYLMPKGINIMGVIGKK